MTETARERSEARIVQLTFFLPNRLGTLRQVNELLEEGGVGLLGLVILDAADHAVIRMVPNDPDRAAEVLDTQGYAHTRTELLGVGLGEGGQPGLGHLLRTLLGAEVNVAYLYALQVRVDDRPVVALQADDLVLASRVLGGCGFAIVGHDDLAWRGT